MFDNDTFEGIHYSRFIASWYKAGGGPYYAMIKDWLLKLVINGKSMDDETARKIADMAVCGKLEFETSAKNYNRELDENIKKRMRYGLG